MLNFEGFFDKPNKITFLGVSLLSSLTCRPKFLEFTFYHLNNSRIGKNTTSMGVEFLGISKLFLYEDADFRFSFMVLVLVCYKSL